MIQVKQWSKRKDGWGLWRKFIVKNIKKIKFWKKISSLNPKSVSSTSSYATIIKDV